MKWQALMLVFATAVALFVGGTRWQHRIGARIAFEATSSGNHWELVYADSTGLREIRGTGSPRTLPGYEKLPYMSGGWDITPDLSHVAYIDLYNYGQPQLKVVPAHRADHPVAFAASAAGDQLQCPLFDADGSVLFLRAPGTSTNWTLMRMAGPFPDRSAAHPTSTTEVRLPVAASADDCPEVSADGSEIAWIGTDHAIHASPRHGDRIDPGITLTGAEFELAPSGAWLARVDGANLVTVDVATGTTRTVASNVGGGRVLAISPDGAWIATSSTSTWGSRWSAWRVRDGAEVPLDVGVSAYTGWDNRRKAWLKHS